MLSYCRFAAQLYEQLLLARMLIRVTKSYRGRIQYIMTVQSMDTMQTGDLPG